MPKYLFTMDRTCRVCTKETEGIFIYSDKGKEMQLENKITKYLYLQVTENDPFPKTICSECLKILKAIDSLAEVAALSQAKLSSCFKSLNPNLINLVKEEWNGDIESSDSDSEQTKPSLLHSILTKNQHNDVTEMEVNIDPSLFFEEESFDKTDLKTNNGLDNDETSKNDTEVKPYQCSLCPRGFNTDLSLKNHLWNHLPSRKFLTSADLNRFQLHPVYKNTIADAQCLCQVCGRIYPTKSTLRAHQITHSNLRPHKCTLCEKTFKRNQDLKFHINQHTGERPYRCPYCPKAFASSGNCFSHRKRMHPKQLARDKKRVLH